MIIVDGHEDLAYNTLVDGRNYLDSALAIRASEVGGPVPEYNGLCMLGLPEWLSGGVAVVFATLLAIPRSEAFLGEPGYLNPEGAHQIAMAQMRIYRDWAANHPQIKLITHQQHLDDVLASWSETPSGDTDRRQVGLVILIENADVVREPQEVGFWHTQGVRLIGPAWHSNRYTGSTKEPGPLTDLGRELLVEMDRCGMVLDLSHMSDEACYEALDLYSGPVVATHSNPRSIVDRYRLLPDDIIRKLAERDGIIGIMPLNWALDPTWREHRVKANVHLDAVVDAIDAICQIAGDAKHVAIGTDVDGGQGAECAPAELDTIADLPKLSEALDRRGYDSESVEAIMGGNWLRLLRKHLPYER